MLHTSTLRLSTVDPTSGRIRQGATSAPHPITRPQTIPAASGMTHFARGAVAHIGGRTAPSIVGFNVRIQGMDLSHSPNTLYWPHHSSRITNSQLASKR